MRLHSLPFSNDVKRAIYDSLHPGNLNPDEKTIDSYDLCTGRGLHREDTVNGYRNTVLNCGGTLRVVHRINSL